MKPALIVIVGPTAAGKTAFAIQLAVQLNGEIVSADSRLFYRGMDIGTAKPTSVERKLVPHHLIDVADPDETWSLAVFQQNAASAIADIHNRGKLPFLVGGTGQYVSAVTHGWAPPTTRPNPHLRSILEGMAYSNGSLWLHKRLAILDWEAADGIDPRNLRRTVRALEVIFSTGGKFSSQRGRKEGSWRLLTIGLTRPRPEIYARVDARIEAMFTDGLLDEVRTLLAKGYSPGLPTLSAIGYRECTLVLQGRMSLEEAKRRMRQLTRNFVRRQANWFKAQDEDIHWFTAGQDEVKAAGKLILRFLRSKRK
jgi:tRNA dimethylallyltransferase